MQEKKKKRHQIPGIQLDDKATAVRQASVPKVPPTPDPWFYCNPVHGSKQQN